METDHVRAVAETSWTRLPDGWYRRFESRMLVRLNCHGLGMADANLAVHRHAEGGAEDIAPPCVRDPGVAAAVVEMADREAMPRINERCPYQDDPEEQMRAWEEEFGRVAKECAVGITPRALMRLWAGCLAAAKAMSPTNYWIGPISPWMRYNLFRHSVFPDCRRDEVFRLGALAAPAFKAWRREEVTAAGIPLRTCGDPGFMRWGDPRVIRPGPAPGVRTGPCPGAPT